jgi:hypothetical protein
MPTEPRDSYASGIRIPHSSPSAKSNSRSDKRFCYRTSPKRSKTFLPGRLLCRFDCVDNRILKTTRDHVSGKVDRAEGLLRLRDTDTSLITFCEK